MEQILWAVKAAPVADAQEWAVLVAMSEAADQDGCNSFLSIMTIAARTRLAESTVRRRMGDLEDRGLIRQGDQRSALMIPANRRPVVYDLQVPLSYFRAEKRYDGAEAELSVNIWRAGRGRPPLTPQDRPELAPAPERKPRADKAPDSGVSQRHPKPGVSEGHPQGFHADTPRGVPGTPNPPHNPPQDPRSSGALRAPTAGPVEISSSNAQSRNADAAAHEPEGDHGDAPRAVGSPSSILDAMMLNPDEQTRFRTWLIEATGATNPEGLVVSLHGAGRLSERITQWRGFEIAPAPQQPAQDRPVHLAWCGRCDHRTRMAMATDPEGREYVRRCPDCNINAGQPAPGSGAAQAIAFEAAVAAANDANGRGRAAFEAARAALPQGAPRRTTTIGDVIPTSRLRAESEQNA